MAAPFFLPLEQKFLIFAVEIIIASAQIPKSEGDLKKGSAQLFAVPIPFFNLNF